MVVVLLRASDDPETVYDDVCERLHNSGLRTVVIGAQDHALTERSVLAVLDELSLAWVNLVGNKDGADVAWLLAARTFGRFVSLIVMDRGHPAIADGQGHVLAEDCPAVEMPTTVLVGDADLPRLRRIVRATRVFRVPRGPPPGWRRHRVGEQ